ncbi:YtpI family protein [Cytobacillus horneckiae]|uniref:YtpI family protein n=1 Tax=Cytobacillus horneckiae TaxID=549687 RepID=UPI00204204F7|nr:YtpI family protein [Cytobacillus horneckiae]MCM3179605.1 YtpI family protein [Cytobacillus horneckiae]
MPVLVIFIVLSFAFYVFYKVKYVRSKRPAEKQWISAKSRIALGIFVAFFGINQLFLYSTTTTYIVAAVFIVIGGLSIWTGIKAYKYFLPLAAEEAQWLKTNQQ